MSRRIWLTGASSGIGAALAEVLLQQGHRLALSARNAGALHALAERYPGQVLQAPGDLTDPEQVRAIGERIGEHWGALDQAILIAGTCEYVDVQDFQAAMVERVMRANLFSAAHCVEAALPLLRQGERPHLVAVSSSVTWSLVLDWSSCAGACCAATGIAYSASAIDAASMETGVFFVSYALRIWNPSRDAWIRFVRDVDDCIALA